MPAETIFRLADPTADQAKLDPLFAAMQSDFSASGALVESGRITRLLNRHPGCEVLLAERNDTAIGFASFSIVFPNADLAPILYLRVIFVMPAERSKGVGAELMRQVAGMALKRSCVRVDWSTHTANEKAQNFYETLGAARMTHVVNYKLEGDALRKLARSAS